MTDTVLMNHALGLARRGLGRVAENPAVGALIVKQGRILGRGWTQPGGRPHAETRALHQATEIYGADDVKGATAYVTLEPCAHKGKTGPCVEALIEAGVSKVVTAMTDPDPRTAGQGHARLRAAGIEVIEGVCEAEARSLNEGFVTRITQGRPLVALKIATSLDGKIATTKGDSQWITGAEARHRAHLMRARMDGLLVGSGTALADDPNLTCRVPGLEDRSPLRIVMDGRLRLPLTYTLVKTAKEVPTLLVTLKGADKDRIKAYEQAGVGILQIDADGAGRPDVILMLKALGERGLNRLMVEGGSHLAGSLLRAGVVDRIAWFRAASVMGADGLHAIAPFGVEKLAQMPRFTRIGHEILGQDCLDIYARRT